MRKTQLHIFDFDGTIFFSPAPPSHMEHPSSRYSSKLEGQLYSPLSSGGLGWFQSLSSLSPPHVPKSPEIDKWFEPNVLKRIRLLTSLVERVHSENMTAEGDNETKEHRVHKNNEEDANVHTKHVIDVDALSHSSSETEPSGTEVEANTSHPHSHSHSSAAKANVTNEEEEEEQQQEEEIIRKSTADIKLFVLTGRDEKYRARIEQLLAHAGILPFITQVFLKPFETAGTVRYKLDTFMHLIEQHHPTHVYYYEDRMEQGGKLLLGVHTIQEHLCKRLQEQHLEEQESLSSEISVTCELKEMHDSCIRKQQNLHSQSNNDDHNRKNTKEADNALHTRQNNEEAKNNSNNNNNNSNNNIDDKHTSDVDKENAATEYDNECKHDHILATLRDGESTFKRKCMELCFDYNPTVMQRAERQVNQWLQNYNTTKERIRSNNNHSNKVQTTLPIGGKNKPPSAFVTEKCVDLQPFDFSMILVPASTREQSTSMLNADQVDALVSSLHAERNEYVAHRENLSDREKPHQPYRPYNKQCRKR